MDSAEFLQTVHGHIAGMIDDEGAFGGLGAYAWALQDKGDHEGVTVMALALPPGDAWIMALMKMSEPETRQLVFGLDRYGKPGQGTSPGNDLVAGIYYERGAPEELRAFIIEYAPAPLKRTLWFNWTNAFWCAVIVHELKGAAAAGMELVQKAKE